MATEGRIEKWKRKNRAHLQRYQRNYYRATKRAYLEERLAKVKAEAKKADGPRARLLEIEAKELTLKLDRLRLQERHEEGAA